jgi:protein gp37
VGSRTKIEWTMSPDGTPGATWSPITGCTPCSPGCDHCYARRMLARHLPGMGHPGDPGEVTFHPDRLDIPLHWRKPKRIFVCSMSDLFHPDVPNRWRWQIFSTMASCPRQPYMARNPCSSLSKSH